MRPNAIPFTVAMLLSAARLAVAQFNLPTVYNTHLGRPWAGPNTCIEGPFFTACSSRSRPVCCRVQPHGGSIFLMPRMSALC